jgi:propanol-preferring alcohol dehydrogenase
MKAYVLEEFGKPLHERSIDAPAPTGKEVLVRVRSTGLCHSDLHFQDGYLSLGGDARLNLPDIGIVPPLIMGHETYGEIDDFGPDSGLTAADKGRPVIVYPWLGCGTCGFCTSGRDNQCQAARQIGVHDPGGHAELIIVREPKFLVDATGIDPVIAGPYSCSGLTGYSALRKLGERQKEWIAIIGLGGVGLMTLAVAKGLGFEKIVAIDIDDAKLATATADYGADLAFNSTHDDVADRIRTETGGLSGAVDLVGSTESVALGAGLLGQGGVYVSVGLFGGELRFPLPPLAVMQLQFRGSFTGTLDELNELVAIVRQGRVKPIPTRAVPIDQVNECIAELRGGKVSGRIVLTHA